MAVFFWDIAPCSLVEIDRLLEVLTAYITVALVMEAVSSSETSFSCYLTTRRNIPEDSHIHTRRRENLKSEQYTPEL
jgi:hypothetical protein